MTAQTNDLKNPAQILRAARDFVSRGWCVHALALNRQGEGCARGSYDPDAVQWCAIGALGAALGVYHAYYDSPEGKMCTELLARQLPGDEDDPLGKVVDFNNQTSQPHVLDLFDRAIYSQRGYDFAAFRAAALTALKDAT